MTAKPICQILAWNYEKKKDYVDHLRAQWKTDYRNGLGPKRPNFHNWRGSAFAPVIVDRRSALGSGWVQTRSRNRAFTYRDRLGRLEWFETGKINIWLKKPANPGRLSQLMANAFFKTDLVKDPRILQVFIESVTFQGAHAVYDTGERLPYARIEDFRESNGVVIKIGDLSHPTAVEIEFYRPSWGEEMRETMDAFVDSLKKLNGAGKPSLEKNIGLV